MPEEVNDRNVIKARPMPETRQPMRPHLRWALVAKDGEWEMGPETYENERLALEVRDRCCRPEHEVEPQPVIVAEVVKETL